MIGHVLFTFLQNGGQVLKGVQKKVHALLGQFDANEQRAPQHGVQHGEAAAAQRGSKDATLGGRRKDATVGGSFCPGT